MGVILTLLRYIIIYAVIISGSIFIADKANKKIEKCIAPNMAIIILALYVFGIFDILIYGVWTIVIANILLGLYTIIKNWKNKQELKTKIMTPGFTFFSIVFFVLMITSYNKNLVDFDHYLYRSLNTKIMYYTDTMCRGLKMLYPPSINLLEYFFMKIIGAYIQGVEAFTVQILGFSLLLPIFDKIKNNKFMNTVVSIVILCVPAIFSNLIFYQSAYPDALLGLLIGYSMYILYTEKDNKFKLFSVILALAVTTLTKPAGFYIAGIVVGMYTLIELLNYKCNTKQNIIKFLKSKELRNIIIITIAVIAVFVSWKIFASINKNNGSGVVRPDQPRTEGDPGNYLVNSILTTVFGYYQENHTAADSNNTLIDDIYSFYAVISPVRITLYGTITITMISAIAIYKYVIKEENKKKFANTVIGLTVGMAVYIVFLQISYILKFSTDEMLDHSGLNRYLPTFLLGMVYFIVAIAIKNMQEKQDKKINYIILLAIIITFTPLQSIANVTITSGIYNIQSIEYCNNGRILANQLDEKFEDDAKFISIAQEKSTYVYSHMLKYYLYPNHTVYVYEHIHEGYVKSIRQKMLNENISYIYIFSTDENLDKAFNKYFGIETLEPETLYKLETQNDNIELIKIPLD